MAKQHSALLRVSNRVVIDGELPNDCAARVTEAHEYRNPQHYKVKGMGYVPPVTEPATIRTWRHELCGGRQRLTVPRGGISKVREILTDCGVAWQVRDERTSGGSIGKPPSKVLLDLRPYQQRAVAEILKRQNTLLHAPTGCGKTCIANAAIAAAQVPALIIVRNANLLKQWTERVERELGCTVGVVRGGNVVLRPVTIAMQQTLWRFDDEKWDAFADKFGMVIVDEVQEVAARTVAEVVDRFPAKYRIGMSADSTRRDGKEFITRDVFGGAIEVRQQDLLDAGFVHEVELYVVPTDFRASWYVQQRNSNRRPDFNRLLEEMTADDARNEWIASIVHWCAVDAQSPTLVFSHRVAHCRQIKAMLSGAPRYADPVPTRCMLGGDECAAEFAEAAAGLMSGAVKVGVGTIEAIKQGIDVPAVGRGVITTPCHNNRQQWAQMCGRLSRAHRDKSDARMYYLMDVNVFGTEPLRQLAKLHTTVKVLHEDIWIGADEYVDRRKGKRDAEAERDSGIDTDGLDAIDRLFGQIG